MENTKLVKERVLTGDRPSGCLHLGHYVGSLKSRIDIQHTHDQYIMIADAQALTDNFNNPDLVAKNIIEVAKDYISSGIDANKNTIFIQSQIPQIAELTSYYMNLVTIGRLQRNPTVKNEIKQKGYDMSIPAGFLCYPVSQAADITIFLAKIIPVGEDQLPIIEQTNEIVRKFNDVYNTKYLPECTPLLSSTPRLVGIDGKAKASKSLGNAILLSDTKEDIKRKVFQMYTDKNHLKISDPGSIDGNVVFEYLDIFHENKEELLELKNHYKRGGLGDFTLKSILNNDLQIFIDPIREKRSKITDSYIIEMLYHNTNKARKVAEHTLQEIKKIMKIDYFSQLE